MHHESGEKTTLQVLDLDCKERSSQIYPDSQSHAYCSRAMSKWDNDTTRDMPHHVESKRQYNRGTACQIKPNYHRHLHHVRIETQGINLLRDGEEILAAPPTAILGVGSRW